MRKMNYPFRTGGLLLLVVNVATQSHNFGLIADYRVPFI